MNPHASFHPRIIDQARELDHSSSCVTDLESPGITQRLWVGAQLLASILGPINRYDLCYVIEKAEHWAAAADALACALLEQQQQKAGMLTPELLLEWQQIVEGRRRRRQEEAADLQPGTTEQGGAQ